MHISPHTGMTSNIGLPSWHVTELPPYLICTNKGPGLNRNIYVAIFSIALMLLDYCMSKAFHNGNINGPTFKIHTFRSRDLCENVLWACNSNLVQNALCSNFDYNYLIQGNSKFAHHVTAPLSRHGQHYDKNMFGSWFTFFVFYSGSISIGLTHIIQDFFIVTGSAPVPVKQPWLIWVNKSHESIRNW